MRIFTAAAAQGDFIKAVLGAELRAVMLLERKPRAGHATNKASRPRLVNAGGLFFKRPSAPPSPRPGIQPGARRGSELIALSGLDFTWNDSPGYLGHGLTRRGIRIQRQLFDEAFLLRRMLMMRMLMTFLPFLYQAPNGGWNC